MMLSMIRTSTGDLYDSSRNPRSSRSAVTYGNVEAGASFGDQSGLKYAPARSAAGSASGDSIDRARSSLKACLCLSVITDGLEPLRAACNLSVCSWKAMRISNFTGSLTLLIRHLGGVRCSFPFVAASVGRITAVSKLCGGCATTILGSGAANAAMRAS
jgi:hypothetical protein